LSKFQRFVAGSGHILNDVTASIWFSYFILFMHKVTNLDETYCGALLLWGQVIHWKISNIWLWYAIMISCMNEQSTLRCSLCKINFQMIDGFATPTVGYLTDRFTSLWPCKKNYGRCKSWHLLGQWKLSTKQCLMILIYLILGHPDTNGNVLVFLISHHLIMLISRSYYCVLHNTLHLCTRYWIQFRHKGLVRSCWLEKGLILRFIRHVVSNRMGIVWDLPFSPDTKTNAKWINKNRNTCH